MKHDNLNISLAEVDITPIYQCQCCFGTGFFQFKLPDDGICPKHGYPMKVTRTFGDHYRSLRDHLRQSNSAHS